MREPNLFSTSSAPSEENPPKKPALFSYFGQQCALTPFSALFFCSQAGNRWLSERLHMGRPEAISVHIGRLRKAGAAENDDYRRLSTIVSA